MFTTKQMKNDCLKRSEQNEANVAIVYNESRKVTIVIFRLLRHSDYLCRDSRSNSRLTFVQKIFMSCIREFVTRSVFIQLYETRTNVIWIRNCSTYSANDVTHAGRAIGQLELSLIGHKVAAVAPYLLELYLILPNLILQYT